MAETSKLEIHADFMLFECYIRDLDASLVRLFRAPTVLDTSGSNQRFPSEVAFVELRAGDLVIALQIESQAIGGNVMAALQFWRILEMNSGEARVLVNNLVGSGGEGEFVYSRLAAMVGLASNGQL